MKLKQRIWSWKTYFAFLLMGLFVFLPVAVQSQTTDGRIIIKKQTNPDGSPQAFEFIGEITTTLTDGTREWKVVPPGQYTVTESVLSGWTLMDITLNDGSSATPSTYNLETGTVTFNVDPGENVLAIFTNRQESKIIIEKQTDPDGSSQAFEFTGEITTTLTDGGNEEKVVPPGTYYVTETSESGWALTDITLDDGNSSGDTETRTATFVVEAGETVKAVFTNRQDGKIIIEKQTSPDGSLQEFDFTDEITATLTDGNFKEKVVPPGTYYVTESGESGWALTDITLDDGNSSGNTESRTATFVVEAGETVKAVFTNEQLGTIGNFVWNDLNRDGIQGTGEPGVESVTVNLYLKDGDVLQDTKVTDASGAYLFENVSAGTYYVEFLNIPSDDEFTTADAGTDDAVDSDADAGTGKTGDIVLASGETQLTWDAGIREKLGSIGNFVWNDLNRDGIQGTGEPGVESVTVNLYLKDGDVLQDTKVTDASGAYLFENVSAGTYYVEFSNIPSDDEFTTADAGTDDAVDSDADAGTGKTGDIVLASGETQLTWDAGIREKLGSIGNFVWNDLNRDGIQGTGEPGVESVTVNLYLKDGDVLQDTKVTDASGAYLFENVSAGTYYVEFLNIPSDDEFTTADAGTDDAVDSDADAGTGKTGDIVLASGETQLTWDAGIREKLGSIGNFVWNDLNRDGIQDDGEPGVESVTVNLYLKDGDVLQDTKVTDASGAYLFENVSAGTYYVEFLNIPSDDEFTTADAGTDDTVDSDADAGTGKTGDIVLASGETQLTWDAGIREKLGSIGNFVWNDLNRDGIQDDGEPGVESVTVNLYLKDGDVLQDTKVTDASGAYLFENVSAGTYYVEFLNIPSDDEFTTADAGTDDTVDSDADAGTGKTGDIVLASGETQLTWDAGIREKLGSIGNFVWNDLNRDGIQGTGEPGVESVTVNLYLKDGDVLQDTKVTDASGAYLFENVSAGTYYVEFSNIPSDDEFTTADAGTDDAVDSDADAGTGKTGDIVLASGETQLTWDAGIRILFAAIGDFVWNDTDADGIQDDGEEGIEDITVNLYMMTSSTPGTPYRTTTTNATGYYKFENLEPTDYLIEFVIESGLLISPQNMGGDDSKDSDADADGKTEIITLDPGEEDWSWDCGFVPLASIGNFIWNDINQDGIQDQGEPGIENVLVSIYRDDGDGVADPGGTADTFVDSMRTDYTGYYLFTDLLPGVYYFVFHLPPDWTFTAAGATNDSNDSDADPATGISALVTLQPGENNTDWDAGMYQELGSIGDMVWYDTNENKIKDPGETGIENVMLHLYKGGVYHSTKYTTASGWYRFNDLAAGRYKVDVVNTTIPEGYYRTTDFDPISHDLSPGENYDDADFGYNNFLPQPEPGKNRIIARYQPWYGDAESEEALRHWNFNLFGGQADTSLFETYDSYDPKVWAYHILAAWACGIDGFAVDWYGQESYENPPIKGLMDVADFLYQKYNDKGFDFEIACSYNEKAQGDVDDNFIYIADSLMTHPAYWGVRRQTVRPLFFYDYEDTVHTPDEYRACADTTLPSNAILLMNGSEIDKFESMDVVHAWAEGEWETWSDTEWDPMGMEWGEAYLDTSYWRVNYLAVPNSLQFALGVVWPGHDDREWSLSEDHFMDRQDTLVYELTWEKVHEYNYPLPLNWVYIETWNDFNHASEIEPSVDHDYKFNVLTRDHARRFKAPIPPDSVGVDNLGLLVPQHLHQAAIAAELRPDEAAAILASIELATEHFFEREHILSLSVADHAAGIAPQPITFDEIGDTYVQISWGPAVHANNYNVYFSTKAECFEPCAFEKPEKISVGNVTEFILTGLNSSEEYYIAVTAADTALGSYANESWYTNTITGADVKGVITFGSTDVADVEKLLPKEFALEQNYPNPFNPETTIEYALPTAQHVVIKLYDMRGREIETLVDEQQEPGFFKVNYNAVHLPSGIYLYRIAADKFVQIRKMTLLK